MANPYDILIHREPIDPPPDFDLAAVVVKMYQSSGDEEWGVFRSYDLAPFLPKGAKLFEALKSLTDKGWILYLRGADYRAEPSLIIACLRAGLGKNRQLNR